MGPFEQYSKFRYECPECGLAYATGEELEMHDLLRHEPRRVRTFFVCSYCPATFGTPEKCVYNAVLK